MEVKDYIILNSAGNLYWKNREGVYLGCNQNMAKVFKLSSPGEIAGKTDYDFFLKKEFVEKIIKNDRKVMESGQAQVFEEIGTDTNQKMAIYLTKKMPLKNELNQIVGVMGTSIDITELKLAEENEKKAFLKALEAKHQAQTEAQIREAVTVLAGSISHDLRTPLTSLEIYNSILKNCWPSMLDAYQQARNAKLPILNNNSKIESQIQLLNDIGNTFEKIIQQMQLFIQTSLKTMRASTCKEINKNDLVICSLNQVLSTVLEHYPCSIEERKLIIWEQNQDAEFNFMGNEVLFMRIMNNLINNAFHQIRQNKRGKIFIRAEKNKDLNRLYVKDTAGGASPAQMQRLFHAYESSKAQGTGIGLAFCKIIMQQFGGEIICQSKEGQYMEFILSFPNITSTSLFSPAA